jgi:hypothetical protein
VCCYSVTTLGHILHTSVLLQWPSAVIIRIVLSGKSNEEKQDVFLKRLGMQRFFIFFQKSFSLVDLKNVYAGNIYVY